MDNNERRTDSKDESAAWQALVSFTRNANWAILHELDCRNFDRFIVLAHEQGGCNPGEVKTYLSGQVDAPDKVELLVERLEIGLSVLDRYREEMLGLD
jgi:hypothetical protein